jgi:FkbM family methyltransferase
MLKKTKNLSLFLLKACYRKTKNFSEWYSYRAYKPGHVFTSKVDDDVFKLTFANYKLRGAIVDRIKGKREPDTAAIIRSTVPQGSTVLEIGGCYGYFTLIMSRSAGPEGRVISIKGVPNNFEILKTNLALNDAKNVLPLNYFVTSKTPSVTFGEKENNPYAAIKRIEQKKSVKGNSVETIKVSNLLDQKNILPDFIFMDIEGFEVEVIEDLIEKFFHKHKPILIFELHECFYPEGKKTDYLRKELERAGYYTRKSGTNLICHPKK